ncbi:MAG: hypothetical protein ACXIUD_11505 [Mongoliitalea sp.]
MRTFYTEHGKIVFESDRILIEDNAKKEKISQMFIGFTGFLVGISQIYSSFQGEGWFWFGVGICIINGGLIIAYFFRSIAPEIPFSQIKSIKVKNRLGIYHLDIKLQNMKSRHVNGSFSHETLQQYISEVFPK